MVCRAWTFALYYCRSHVQITPVVQTNTLLPTPAPNCPVHNSRVRRPHTPATPATLVGVTPTDRGASYRCDSWLHGLWTCKGRYQTQLTIDCAACWKMGLGIEQQRGTSETNQQDKYVLPMEFDAINAIMSNMSIMNIHCTPKTNHLPVQNNAS